MSEDTGKSKKVPKLRFPGFTDDWEQRRLGEIAVKAVDNRGKTPPLSSKGEHPLIEVACLGNYSPDYSKVEKYLEENIFKSALRNYIKKGDILFSTVGNIGLVSLMDDNESAAIAQNIVAFRAKEDFDHRFLYSMFSTKVNRNLAMRITMGAVQPSIKVSQLLDVKYFITDSVDEQQKIGEFFEQLDYHITFQQRKLDHLKERKKALLQKMFPKEGTNVPELRFPGFTDAWEQRRLGEVANKFDNLRKPVVASKRKPGEVPYYGANGIQDYVDGFTHEGEFLLIAEDGANDLKDYPIHYVVGRLWVNNHAHVLQGMMNVTSTKFLSYALKSISFKEWVSGSSRVKLNADEMMRIPLSLPKIVEQQQIGQFFELLDNHITVQQRKLDHLKLRKKALLQQMFV